MESRAANMTSLLSFGKYFRLIFTLNYVSSWRSQSDASKGDASTRSRIALAVALPVVNDIWVAVVAPRLRRASLADRVGMNGSCYLRPCPRGAAGVHVGTFFVLSEFGIMGVRCVTEGIWG